MLGSRVAREYTCDVCPRRWEISGDWTVLPIVVCKPHAVNRSSTQNLRSVICSVPFSLFKDPLFSLQSPSSARGKKYKQRGIY